MQHMKNGEIMRASWLKHHASGHTPVAPIVEESEKTRTSSSCRE